MKGDGIGVSGIDSAEISGVDEMEGVSEIKSNADAMKHNIVGVSETKNSEDVMIQAIDSVDGKKVREMKDDMMNVNIEVKEEYMQVKRMRMANMEGIVRDGMKVTDGTVARINNVKGMNALGVIEKGNDMKEKQIENSDGIDVGANQIGLEKKGTVKLATPETVAEKKPPTEVKVEAINTDTDIKHVDLEQAGIERLAKMERLAENERQAKIKRREELDRVARLQRILALVRAPELDSVAKMKQVNLDEKEIKRDEDINVLKELSISPELNSSIDRLSVDEKQLTKVETVNEALANKKQIEYEGIAKLERMSKEERILEIHRLVNLELEAEAKLKAAIEHAAQLEREAELEREIKMKYLRELNLKAELEKVEKKRLAEIERQEKMKRKEELDRISEIKQAKLNQTVEMKRKEEIKLLVELGILPRHEGTEKDSVRKLESEGKANLNPEIDINLVKEVKPKTDVKEEVADPVKRTISILEIKEVDPIVDLETGANAEQTTQKESESMNELIEDTQKEANKNQEAESKTNIYNEARKKRREELERVARLQRIIATVRNAEPNGVTQVKIDVDVDNTPDLKHAEEMQLLEELGIVPKKHVTQKESEIDGHVEKLKVQPNNLNSVKQMHPDSDVKQVTEVKADVNISTEPNAEQLTEKLAEIKMGKAVESEREAKIKRAAEMERKAKAKHEAKIKRREELDRMANLQRVAALVSNEEFDHVANMKEAELIQMKENKREEDLKVLEALGIVPRKESTQTESETNLKTADKKEILTKTENTTDVKFKIDKGGVDFGPANAEKMPERIVDMETMTDKERKAVRQDVERRIVELRVVQMKRVAELGKEMKQLAMIDEDLKSKHKNLKQMSKNEHKNKDVTDESKQIIKDEYKIEDANKSKQLESKPMVVTERNINVTDVKRIKEKQLDFSLAEIKGIKRKEDEKPLVDLNSEKEKDVKCNEKNIFTDFETPEVKQERVESLGMKIEKGLKSTAVPPLIEVKSEPVMELVELKRSSEMKAGGMERVRRRDCEWDGQMMYVGRERL
ncbi:titin homolog [Cydia fagiglandana]|uniref:titin homolog n=1 Tax=Cydia fagiglandana TaxID=1458189 RepID=UPI002FEE5348